jgi:hypothetical protein
MDEDDWYAPHFMQTMMTAVQSARSEVCRPSFAILGQFLFFDVARSQIRRSRRQIAPGATLLFPREDWEHQPFRAVSRDEDVWFARDQQRAGAEIIAVDALESFLAVRHRGSEKDRGHTWTHQGNGGILEDKLQNRPLHNHSPEDSPPEWALAVYHELHRDLSSMLPV